jgi:hypothetical protein
VPVENLANLVYLIRQECDRPEQVLEYVSIADIQLSRLIAMVTEAYESLPK